MNKLLNTALMYALGKLPCSKLWYVMYQQGLMSLAPCFNQILPLTNEDETEHMVPSW